MKLKYRVWLAVYKWLPWTKDNKIMFEPYRGFIHDLKKLRMAEHDWLENDHDLEYDLCLKSKVDEIERRIKRNTYKWNHLGKW